MPLLSPSPRHSYIQNIMTAMTGIRISHSSVVASQGKYPSRDIRPSKTAAEEMCSWWSHDAFHVRFLTRNSTIKSFNQLTTKLEGDSVGNFHATSPWDAKGKGKAEMLGPSPSSQRVFSRTQNGPYKAS